MRMTAAAGIHAGSRNKGQGGRMECGIEDEDFVKDGKRRRQGGAAGGAPRWRATKGVETTWNAPFTSHSDVHMRMPQPSADAWTAAARCKLKETVLRLISIGSVVPSTLLLCPHG
jgi:hypothetical protein